MLTNRLHIYLQQLIKLLELQTQNIIKDTTDFINKLKTFDKNIPENTYLVAFDLESLYTNIPIKWVIYALVEHYTIHSSIGVVMILTLNQSLPDS